MLRSTSDLVGGLTMLHVAVSRLMRRSIYLSGKTTAEAQQLTNAEEYLVAFHELQAMCNLPQVALQHTPPEHLRHMIAVLAADIRTYDGTERANKHRNYPSGWRESMRFAATANEEESNGTGETETTTNETNADAGGDAPSGENRPPS